jgi:hypothetical protein
MGQLLQIDQLQPERQECSHGPHLQTHRSRDAVREFASATLSHMDGALLCTLLENARLTMYCVAHTEAVC